MPNAAEADAHRGHEWVFRLRPVNPDLVPSHASTPALINRAAAVVGDEPVRWAIEVGHALATRITREMPGFAEGAGAFDVLRMGTEATTIQSLLLLAGEAVDQPATNEALDGVSEFVRNNLGLDLVLRGIRLGHAGMSEAFLRASVELVDPDARIEIMRRSSAQLFDFIDGFAAAMGERYLREQVRWSTSEVAAKLEAIDGLLGGSFDRADVERRLGIDLDATHIGFIVWSPVTSSAVDALQLQESALLICRRLRATQRVIVPVGARTVWCWATRSASTSLDELAGLLLPAGVVAGIGAEASGVVGFSRTHHEAKAIHTLLGEATPVQSIVNYREVDLLTLLATDRRRALDFMARELGALAEPTVHARDLRETLVTYLHEQSSPQSTALRLHVARNTVTYRLRRIEAILGYRIAERRMQLQAALLLAERFGTLPEEGDRLGPRSPRKANSGQMSGVI